MTENSLLDQNIFLIEQGIELLEQIPDKAYSAARDDSSPAPALGPHFRHCLDFYGCFFDGLELRVIDYGARSRRGDVEADPRVAIAELREVANQLAGIEPSLLGESVELRREGNQDAEPEGWFRSTLARELQFLSSHTIHHYALIALSLRLDGHPVPEDFGVAPSTLRHWRREGRVTR